MSLSYVCCACRQSIVDPLVYECDHKYFHAHCLKCQMCLMPFRDKLYAFNGLLVCRDDYQRMRSNCPVCGQRIDANDYRFELKNKQSIHTQCMSCASCRSSLSRGDRYVLTPDQRLICHKCTHQINGTTPPPQQQQQTTTTTSRRGRKRQTTTTAANHQN